MAGDWIKLHRVVMEHAVFSDDWLFRLFVWCVMKANFKPSTFQGQPVEVGQFVTGRIKASDELGVTPSKWYRGMQSLASPPMNCISISANSNWTTVTVCNYGLYQSGIDESEQQSEQPANSNRTAIEHKRKNSIMQECKEEQDKRALPLALDVPEFAQAWQDWRKHRTEIRKPLKPTQEATQLAECERIGVARAIAMIEHTIAKGWQGLREPEATSKNRQRMFAPGEIRF